MFIDRGRRAERYPWLEWKVRLFLAGACLAVIGMSLELQWLVAIAIVILFAGFLIRFLPGGTGERVEQSDPDLNGMR